MAVLTMEWLRGSAGSHAEVSALWRERPERPDGPVQVTPLKSFRLAPGGAPTGIFYLRGKLKPGVYSFVLRYKGAEPVNGLRATLHLAGAGEVDARELEPVSLDRAGKVILARVLLPDRVLWEQDDWFTGRSESADTVTKFRFPGGVTWTERKGNLR